MKTAAGELGENQAGAPAIDRRAIVLVAEQHLRGPVDDGLQIDAVLQLALAELATVLAPGLVESRPPSPQPLPRPPALARSHEGAVEKRREARGRTRSADARVRGGEARPRAESGLLRRRGDRPWPRLPTWRLTLPAYLAPDPACIHTCIPPSRYRTQLRHTELYRSGCPAPPGEHNTAP